MGIYLNCKKPHDNYQDIVESTYFVDKTAMLTELAPVIEKRKREHIHGQDDKKVGRSNKYICITRPRRFGKTVMANMIAAYFGKGRDSRQLFDGLHVSSYAGFEDHLNKHDVIYISFHEIPRGCKTYQQYIDRIEELLLKDLLREFPDAAIDGQDAVWDVFNRIYELEESVKFIFVLDEWDYIFHRKFVTDDDKLSYIEFLSNLLKDQPYVELAYMTGILPIAKYSSGSELNMFYEYTMATEKKYCAYFGFTETETDRLFSKYLAVTASPQITRNGLRTWYDGYHTMSGERVYNPRSVVAALTNNNLGNYWTSSGPYDEIYYYIEQDVAKVRDDIARMAAGIAVPARVREYAAASLDLASLTSKEEIFSAMVVYGFLSYDRGYVCIPNKELMDKFDDMIRKEQSLGYVFRLARESDRMLAATLAGDTKTMLEVLEYTHNTEIPLLSYSNESDLTVVVTLAYLSARNLYHMEREDKAGTGYVDFIFYPEDKTADCMILELKVDHTAEEAVQQIKDRGYALRFKGKLGETPKYTGRVLAVGLAYDRKTKEHSCKVEVLRDP